MIEISIDVVGTVLDLNVFNFLNEIDFECNNRRCVCADRHVLSNAI